MAFQMSPGVNSSEIDLTTVVPAVSTTVGGFAGNFAWGPIEEITSTPNEIQLSTVFSKPDANTYGQFFTAANFLQYGNNLLVVRAANTGTKNEGTSGGSYQIKNQSDYLQNYSAGSGSDVWFAKYAGALGNNIGVSIADANTFASWTSSGLNYKGYFDSAPSTTPFASTKGGSYDEMHVIVYDTTGKITGVANTVLERFGYVSKASDAKNSDGSTNYYKDVVNSRSKYIWWSKHHSDGTNWGNTASGIAFANLASFRTLTLSGGTDVAPTTGDINRAYDLFGNGDSINVNLLMTGPQSGVVVPNYVVALAETRKDCMVFISPQQSDVVNNVGNEVTAITAYRNQLTSSSYAFMDSGWKYQYDKYNDTYRWLPLNGDIAGLAARTDSDRDPWFSIAGSNRGIIKNVVKLAWNPKKSDRDSIYTIGVNPVVTFPGEGTYLYGDKTMLSRPSAFDRINVRRLFIVLEEAISKAARSTMFEFNDEFTRAQFVNLVEPFLRDVKGRRGIYDFKVVCDTTNNTPEVIDGNSFVGDIYIKPARSINYIQLNFVAVRTGVSFQEVVGQF